MKRFLGILSLNLIVAASLYAGNTGKIAGTVREGKTNEPIPGANVMIMGTTMGSSTNIEGEFFVLNVPVGTYDVKISSLGYTAQTFTGVQVSADQTYELKIKLEETVMEGDEVVVVADRDVIKREITATTKELSAKEIQALPVNTYQEALSRTAGVVGSGTNIHIRGGRRDEILYLVDGLEIKDPQFQQRGLDVSQAAIGEMQVMTAGFNAEYGEAQSAVINLVIQDGDPEYHGRAKHIMDFDGSKYYQDYDYTEASFSGPEPITQKLLPKLGAKIPGFMSLYGAGTIWSRNTNEFGTYINSDRWYRHQVADLLGSEVRKNEANSNSNLKLTYKPDPALKFSFGWNQAQQWQNPFWYRLSRRFPYDYTAEEQTAGIWALSSIRSLRTNAQDTDNLFGIDDDGDNRTDEEALNWQDDDGDGRIDEDVQLYEYNANNHTRTDRIRDQQFNFGFTHNLSQKTFYTIRASHYEASRTLSGGNKAANEYGEHSESFTDLPNSEGVMNGRYDIGEPFVDSDGDGMYDYGNPDNAYVNVNGFYLSGDGLAGNYQQLVPDWANFSSATSTFKFDLTSQLTTKHLAKAGLEYSYYSVSTEDRPYPSINDGGAGIYTDIYTYYPSAGALYLQDKMEYNDIIVNLGMRMDYWRIGSKNIDNPVARDTTQNNYVDYEPPNSSGDAYFSPRLGIAYSVTDKDVFHFNYGYFHQRGRQDYYFTAVNQLQTGGTPIIGNPDLEPMKTISYELGVRHQFGYDFLFDATTYYKDIKNWIQTASQNQLYYDLYGRTIVGSNAAIYYNADYASVRGFEFNLSKDYGSHFSGRLTYTLSWATGKNSYDIGSDVTRQNYTDPKRETPLAWDRRHQLVGNIGLNYPLEGKAFTKKWWKSGWSVNVLSQGLSGLPYTPTNANGTDVEGQEFAERSPWTYTTDLNVSRAFQAGKLNWRLLLEVRNLFNAVNVLGWDRNRYTLDTYNGGQAGYVNDNASPNYGQNPKAGPNPDAFDNRRLFRAGLSVEF